MTTFSQASYDALVMAAQIQDEVNSASPEATIMHAENLLLEGLRIFLDYINDGDGEDKLASLAERAHCWCLSWYARPDYRPGGIFVNPVPEYVCEMYPDLFDNNVRSLLRLERNPSMPRPLLLPDNDDPSSSANSPGSLAPSEPPSLVDDDGTSDGGTAADVDCNSAGLYIMMQRMAEYVDAGRYRYRLRRPEKFPVWARPQLLHGPIMQRIIERYNGNKKPVSWCQTMSEAAAYDLTVRTCDLHRSPVLSHIPEVLVVIAHKRPAHGADGQDASTAVSDETFEGVVLADPLGPSSDGMLTPPGSPAGGGPPPNTRPRPVGRNPFGLLEGQQLELVGPEPIGTKRQRDDDEEHDATRPRKWLRKVGGQHFIVTETVSKLGL